MQKLKSLISETPPLEIDQDTRWINKENHQLYRPLLRGMAWESEEGSIYPFPPGTRFQYSTNPSLFIEIKAKS